MYILASTAVMNEAMNLSSFICWDVLLSPLGSDTYIAQSSGIKTAVGKRTLG